METREKRLSLNQNHQEKNLNPSSKQRPEIILKSVTTSHKNNASQLPQPLSKPSVENSFNKQKSDQEQQKRISGSFKVMDKMAQISQQKKLSSGKQLY